MLEHDAPGRSALPRFLDGLLGRLTRVTTSGQFIPEIDGLRFIAIALVFFAHVHAYTAIKATGDVAPSLITRADANPFLRLAQCGAWGVQLFFVISGMVLALPFAWHHLRARAKPALGKYFLRRITRLEPPYLATMAGAFVLTVFFGTKALSFGMLLLSFLASSVYAHSLIYGEKSSIQFIIWSLEIEVQFYFLAPLLAGVFAVRGATLRRLLLAGAMLALVACQQVLRFDVYPRLGLSLLNYGQFFLAGFLLADFFVADWDGRPTRSAWWDLVSLAGWPLLFVVIAYAGLKGGPLAAIREVAAPFLIALLYMALFRGVWVRGALTNRWITTIGGMCYSIYLLHVLTISAFGRFTLPLTISSVYSLQLLQQVTLLAVPTLWVSAAFFVLIERPCMRSDWPRSLARWMRNRWFGGSRENGLALQVGEPANGKHRLRVLHLYSGNLYGGIETLLVTFARHRGLCPGMEPSYALCFEGRLHDELSSTGAPVWLLGNVRVSRPWTVWRARRRLRQLLQRERFDLVVCHTCWPHVLFARVVRGMSTPLVFWAHDVPAGQHWLERWAKRTTPDLVLANSRLTQSALGKLFPRGQSEILYYPVAAPALKEGSLVRHRVREALQTSDETTVIIQTSRLEGWKGHHLLLDALGRMTGVPGWVCWIAGGTQRAHEKEYLEELVEKAHRLGLSERVRFLGQRNDVPELLAAADVHCQPNLGPEPFGIAFVEALYAGLPVVTTAIGAAVEIVEDTCGVLVPPADAAKLADALNRLIADKQRRNCLGQAGPARARRLCDPANQLARLSGLFNTLVGKEVAA